MYDRKPQNSVKQLSFYLKIFLKKNLPANAGDMGMIPGFGRSRGVGNGNSLQCSCLKNLMHRGDWRATVHGVAKESDMTQQLNNNTNF